MSYFNYFGREVYIPPSPIQFSESHAFFMPKARLENTLKQITKKNQFV